jgi:hypothetical protein
VTVIILPGDGESMRDVLTAVASVADGRPYKLGMGGVVVADDLARSYLERNDPDRPSDPPPADDEDRATPARKPSTRTAAKRTAAAKKSTGRAPSTGTGG